MRISDWSSDVCSSDLVELLAQPISERSAASTIGAEAADEELLHALPARIVAKANARTVAERRVQILDTAQFHLFAGDHRTRLRRLCNRRLGLGRGDYDVAVERAAPCPIARLRLRGAGEHRGEDRDADATRPKSSAIQPVREGASIGRVEFGHVDRKSTRLNSSH